VNGSAALSERGKTHEVFMQDALPGTNAVVADHNGALDRDGDGGWMQTVLEAEYNARLARRCGGWRALQ
jgi:hypothetical protein